MKELFKKVCLFDIFPFLCRFIAIVLFLLGLSTFDFPLKNNIGSTSLSLFLFSVFFLLLPIAKKISLGKLFTFEREIDKVKNEVTDFKHETREFLNIYSSMITAISNTVNQTVNVNLPGQAETKEVKEELESTLSSKSEPATIEGEINNYINQSSNDLNYALARLRMDIERVLREILGKRIATPDPNAMKGKFLSARQLFREFINQYPQYKGMGNSFDYILKVCNAAIHGQKIVDGHGHEALYMGIKMLKEFESIE